jgi:hypothetical protein
LKCCNFVKSTTAKKSKIVRQFLQKEIKNMKNRKKISSKIMSILLVATVFLLMNVVPVSFGAVIDEYQVKVPLTIDLSHAIAGVQFTFEYSTGLEFVSYEKSAAVSSALTTPVVVKDGYTHFGFYNTDNKYAPTDDKLNVGYLVFNCFNDDSQQVTLTEIKLVQVIDDDTTRSEFLAPVTIKVSPENGSVAPLMDGVSLIDDKSSKVDVVDSVLVTDDEGVSVDNSGDSWLSIGFWIVLVLFIVVLCSAGVFIIIKKRVNIKG